MAPNRASNQLWRLLTLVRPYRWQLVVALIAVVIASGLGLVFPSVIGQLVDSAFGDANGGTGTLNRIALFLFGIFAVQAVFDYFRTYFLALVGEGVVADLRTKLYTHLLGLPVKFFDNRKTGEITSRLTSDVAVVQAAVSQSLAQLVSQSITLVGGVVLIFTISPRLSLVVLAVVPVIILAAVFFGRRLRRVSRDFQDRVADANASAEETIAAVRVVQWFSAQGAQVSHYVGLVQASFQVALKRARIRAIFIPAVTFAMFSAISLVLWYGGRLVFAGTLTGGDLVTFLLYTFTVAGAIGTFTGLYSQIQEALGASSRIFDLLDETSDLPEPRKPVKLGTVTGTLHFEGVSFRYSEHGTDVLKDVSLTVRAGETVALVGPSGAGKSTLISLIPRFYDPTVGRILLDGVDLRDQSLAGLRSHMAAVPQETQLFSGTVAENIRFGDPKATDAELVEAAKAAHAHAFVTAFPDGYDTLVGERGMQVSGGQRQRLAIARALLKNPQVLVLDEATSALDNESEAVVQAALVHLMATRTTVVIAHRLSTVKNADRIVVMDAGRIVQAGSHDELLEQAGLYKELYERQFKVAEPDTVLL